MKIFYLTTALQEDDYEAFLKMGLPVSNPSNQNFHSKVIKSLKSKETIYVVSLISFPTNKVKAINSGDYHYIDYPDDYFEKLFSRKAEVIKTTEGMPTRPDCIIYDPLNISLAKAAPILAKKWKVPLIAILTDNPNNLEKAHHFFTRLVFASVKKTTGVISLSEGLLKAYGVENKPHLVTEGFVEEMPSGETSFPKGSYLYFGGALSPRYGIQDLIEAFLKVPSAYSLLIAGHHGKPVIPSGAESRIHFLGQLSKTDNYLLEKNAALLVNPRPFSTILDQESIPSKMLEFLVSGTPILSTGNSRLENLFPNEVNWIKDSGEKSLENFFLTHLDASGHLINLIPNKASEKALEMYGISHQGEKIHAFLQDLISPSSKSITLPNSK